MIISEKNLDNNLVSSFAYHDAEILKLEESGQDVTILLKDGWVEGQIDQITFSNCKFKCQNDLVGNVIYQLDNICQMGESKWYMSFLVWLEGNTLEKVEVQAENIISKKYQLKDNIETEIKKEDNTVFEEIKKLINKMGITDINDLAKLESEEYKSAERKIWKSKKKYKILNNINNYVLVSEEDLNKEIYGK